MTAAMKALVSGFDAFGGEPVNPSLSILSRLPSRLGALDIVTCRLPVSYAAAPGLLLDQVRDQRPDIVLAVGQAGGRATPTLERIAINLAHADEPDNDGVRLCEQALVEGGPAGYFATLPLALTVSALERAGVPASISYSAGTFVCNAVLYRLLHALPESAPVPVAGFLHVPYLPEQAVRHPGSPSMALDAMVATVEIVLRTAAERS